MTKKREHKSLSLLGELITPETRQLLAGSGKHFVSRVGMEAIRTVVFDVLTGRNIRSSTEILTRRRLSALSVATFEMFIKGSHQADNFVDQIPYMAADILASKKASPSERWFAQWMLGLTGKGVQNVLRDDMSGLPEYRDSYVEACRDTAALQAASSGDLQGTIRIGDKAHTELSWLFVTYLLNTIGSQTLTIRGSEKATYGKLFEKLILGSVLHILGFNLIAPSEDWRSEGVFWLSSKDDKRESDATLLIEAGKGVRFDIGFIGRGNTEISLDKVSRYTKEIERGEKRWYMATFIVVDRIGEQSRIADLARRMDGIVVQMSAGYWPQKIARELRERVGYQHVLADMKHSEVAAYLAERMADVPLERFLSLQLRDTSAQSAGSQSE